MIQKKIIGFVLLCFTFLWFTPSLHAKDTQWQKLKPLEAYVGSAYHLKERVAYMEIRTYSSRKNTKPTQIFKLYKKPLKNYSKDTIKKFKALRAKYSKRADIRANANAFFIDTKGKMFQMDMKKDIVVLLGEIDTLAEVQLLLWLRYEKYAKRCKRTANGYTIKVSEPMAKCTNRNSIIKINKAGNYVTDNAKFYLQRRGCKKRVHTRFVHHKKINYEEYMAIDTDKRGNLYVLGEVKKTKDFDSERYRVLDKYTTDGKRVWSRKLKTYAYRMAVVGKSVYLFEDKELTGKYTLHGKRESFHKTDKLPTLGNNIENNYIPKGVHLPEGLPNKKEMLHVELLDYVKHKGYTYVVGIEMFGSSENAPSGECGMVEQIQGALIAKLNSKGKTLWAKVIDSNE